MTNEMKLLMAFIEASGFDVTSAYIEPELLEVSEEMGIAILSGFSTNNLVTINGVYKRGGNGSYFREIRGGERDYKVTKRKKVSRRNNKSEIHRVVREYEAGIHSVGEMLNEIARIESA